jgi:cytochrome P450
MLKTLISMDGEEHRAYRTDGRVVQAREPAPGAATAVTQLARKYVDRMAELGGACDFALDVARYYPLQVIAEHSACPSPTSCSCWS